ncbi:hypothetical protein [Modestobacter sp. NPDC049651]|uniref:hypothetical protein n=1 Tax=unclassified Modestobacter TaxID=2643866 RepID=UPI0033F547EC
MPIRPVRALAGVAAGALLLLPLAACGSDSGVSCSGRTCTATLSGDDATVSVLGNDLAFAGTQDGKASLSVGDAQVSCAQGEEVSAGPLTLTCTEVTDDSVKLSASLG